MAEVSSTLCYRLADTLAIKLNYDSAAGEIRGKQTRDVNVGPVEVPFEIEVIESAINASKHSIIARIAGNLHVLVTVSPRRTRVYVINYAKIDGPSANMLKAAFGGVMHKHIVAAFGKALVVVYESDGLSKTRWHEFTGTSGD